MAQSSEVEAAAASTGDREHQEEEQDGEDIVHIRQPRGPSGQLEVLAVNFSGRAQRRLARHAARARVRGRGALGTLLVEECVDVEVQSPEAPGAASSASVRNSLRNAAPKALVRNLARPAVAAPKALVRNLARPTRVLPSASVRTRRGSAASAEVSLDLSSGDEDGSPAAPASSGAASSGAASAAAAAAAAFASAAALNAASAAASSAAVHSPLPGSRALLGRATDSSPVEGSHLESVPSSSSSASAFRDHQPGSQRPWHSRSRSRSGSRADFFHGYSHPAGGIAIPSHMRDFQPSTPPRDPPSPATRPAWMLPETSTQQAIAPPRSSIHDANYFVEVIRNGMVSGACSVCGESFMVGQLKIGFTLAMQRERDAPSWVHAPRCTQQANLAVQATDRISFSPFVPSWEQQRVLEELANSHETTRRASPTQWLTQRWQYTPAVQQSWSSRSLEELQAFSVATARRRAAEEWTARPTWAVQRTLPDWPAVQSAMLRARIDQLVQNLGARGLPPPPPPLPPHFQPPAPPRFPPPHPLPMVAVAAGASSAAMAAAGLAALLAAVPVYNLTKREAEHCVVCHEPMRVGDEVRRLPCLHVYHRLCIDRWLGVKATCPLDNLKLEDLVRDQQQMDVVCG